jgi:hypothetical protein
MTFEPVVPPVILIAVTAVLVGIRAVALRRLLRHTRPGRYCHVVLRWSGLTLAVLLLAVAAARPGLHVGGSRSPSVTATAAGSNTNVFFVVDRSVASRVEDFADHTSRMAGIRTDMTALIDHYPRARFAVISFSSAAAVDWPLSNDVWSLKPMIAGLATYTFTPPDALSQVNAAAAGALLRDKLAQADHQYPQSTNLVFYFGEGAGGSPAAQDTFAHRTATVAGGAVLGYGTPTGGAVPQGYVNGEPRYLIDPRTGAALTSAVNEPALTAIAGRLGVPYFHRVQGQSITPVIPALNGAPAGDGADIAASVAGRGELYWVFAAIAAALVLMELYLTIRQFRRNRTARRDVAL